MQELVLKSEGINKSFGGVHALVDMGFELRQGEVHALVGENGAGKSTYIKILSGVQRKDSGTSLYEGRPIDFHGPGGPAGRYRHGPADHRARAQAHRGGEHLHGGLPLRAAGDRQLEGPVPEGAGHGRDLRHAGHGPPPRGEAGHGAPAAHRGPQDPHLRHEDHRLRRAHRGALRRGDAAAVRPHPQAQGEGDLHHLRQPPAGRAVPDRRPHHGPEGRGRHGDARDEGREQGRDRLPHGGPRPQSLWRRHPEEGQERRGRFRRRGRSWRRCRPGGEGPEGDRRGRGELRGAPRGDRRLLRHGRDPAGRKP